MRYLSLVFVFIVFVCLVSYCYNSGKERTKVRDRVMLNSLFLHGEVIEIKTSRNHSFGILLLELDSINTGRFIDTLLKEGIYPYKVKGRKAEVYVGIPADIQKGDRVIIDSDKKKTFYHYIKKDRHYESDIGVLLDPSDIEYVKDNTEFK